MVGVVALTMAAGACSGDRTAGTPTAGGVTGTTGGTTSPARPAELRLDGVQPCELVTDAMRRQFAIDRPDASSATDPNAPVCTFISSTAGRYVVAAVRDHGVQALGRPLDATVSGFAAVQISGTDIPGVCHLGIDVADGQRLDVEVQRRDGTTPLEQVCRDTMTFAEAVLATLRQKLGR